MKRTPLERSTPMRRKGSMGPGRKAPRKARQDGHAIMLTTRKPDPRPSKAQRKNRGPATKSEKEFMARVRRLGCLACRHDTGQWVAPALHHIRQDYGKKRASNWEVLPLCEGHHQGLLDGTKLAFHRASRTWCARYGTEVQLLQVVYEALEMRFDTIPERRAESMKSYREEEPPPWWGGYLRGIHDLNWARPAWTRSLTAQEAP